MGGDFFALDKQKLLNNFNMAAAEYDSVSVLQKYTGKELIDRLQVMRLEPEIIVDLGAGVGNLSRELSNTYKKARVIQLDIAETMLRVSREKTVKRQSYLCADAEALPIKEQSVDLVFSNLMLQWAPSLRTVLSGIVKSLKPGGVFIFATLGPDTLNELRESWAAADDSVHINTFLDMHDIGEAVLAEGFNEPVIERDNIIINYEAVEILMKDLKSLGASNINSERRKTLTGKERLNKMYKEYEKKRNEGAFPATYEVIYGHAWLPMEKTSQEPQQNKTFTISLKALKSSLKNFQNK